MAVDGFTKWTKAYPVNSTSTKEVLCCLDKYFEYYGRPRRIIVDQATCFTAYEFTKRMKELYIELVRVAVGSPQANGQVERVNRVIKAMLGKLTEPIGHANWVQQLAQVEYALNNTKHSTTGFSPSELLFGVSTKICIPDALTEFIENEFHVVANQDLNTVRSQALAAIEKSQKYNEQYVADRCRPAKSYTVGDFVVMKNVDVTAGTNKKFVPKYRGPYVVYKVIGNDRYAVRDVDNCQQTQRPYDNIIEAARLRH